PALLNVLNRAVVQHLVRRNGALFRRSSLLLFLGFSVFCLCFGGNAGEKDCNTYDGQQSSTQSSPLCKSISGFRGAVLTRPEAKHFVLKTLIFSDSSRGRRTGLLDAI